MAPKNKDEKAAQPPGYADVRDAMEALFMNLPDDATLTIDGKTLGQAEILTRLDELREELAMRARLEKLRADWPAPALEARLFARQVREAITRRLDDEAFADFEREERLHPRALAAARGAATREIRGIHLRRRPLPPRRHPWVH